MVSIKDIAKKAGVSISTVSYALNGSSKVTDETSAKILAIARELNYVPNAAARTLKKRESKIVGVFLTDFKGDVYGELLDGMKEVCNAQGYDLIVCSGKQSHRMLPERMIDGAIILDQTFSSEELIQFADRNHRIVVLDRELEHPNINQVLLDNKAGATLATEYLVDRGHKKIYVVTGPEGSYDSNQRMKAVKLVANRSEDVEWIEIPGNFKKSGGERAADRIIQEYTEPAAVFCLNDDMAIGLCDRLADTEYRIGEHIHVIGFDNIEITRYMQPRLATIDYSKHKWGALASEQLIKIISGEKVEHERIYVTLVEGESVGRG
ncbi:LacI family transcriptional regulator [Paenibacillus thiaminolyticus]|uniref:LacI family transcriptional regulator n=1 Tax=Paenibacillus thiaminolyticus TaxID=49283 RepID=A0AAP9DWL7_PANTH|nr:LacI family DNA-binding transcriptional regulator [Paenibacillus thiaminolyticus]MCY9534661.1 LacI family transcriptional regulator [Paenibacillus thiaminolyticus]MCY9603311.1 LacI family transcriptional regulator [Paenibacillus thiaminolyticus]MCY9609983.1 LacI family transcriptional regulator [Paenibacillus thiaminolyticus]MCY9615489.1 LacI family transcriptional regulator [Paenibacillus thiaminolyticus]MCY9617164.1 LacI family transcriptional regulator [Paenibacillus thiaminolyticus]